MVRGRWNDRADEEVRSRAFTEAARLASSWCGVEHALLALLDPPVLTDATAVLSDLGLTRSAAEERFTARSRVSGGDGRGVSPNPAFYGLMGEARGLALASGTDKVTDECLLLALAYGSQRSMLVDFGIDPDAVVGGLAERGHLVPPVLPPKALSPPGPMGLRVYYPAAKHGEVVRAMIRRFPPGTARWGFNVSTWRPGFHYVDAEESCNAFAIIRVAVGDRSVVDEIQLETAASEEARAQGLD